MMLLVAVNLIFLGLDTYLSHIANGTLRPTEWIPIGFGLLTCDTIEQAIERSGTKAGNKGADAALAAIEMVSLLRQIDS